MTAKEAQASHRKDHMMGYWEKINWGVLIGILATTVAYGGYLFVILKPAGAAPGAYWTAVWVVLIGAVLMSILMTVLPSIWTAAKDGELDDVWDERDERIEYRADRVSNYLQSLLIIGVLAMVFMDAAHHWIASALVGIQLLTAIGHFGTKVALYRRVN